MIRIFNFLDFFILFFRKKVNILIDMFALCQKIFQLVSNVVINFILPAVVTALICLIPSSEASKNSEVKQKIEIMPSKRSLPQCKAGCTFYRQQIKHKE